MEALGINLGYLFVQIFNFAILFVVLRVWVLKPILSVLEKRREKIAQGLEDARIAAEARENAEMDAEKIITDARIKANEIIQEATNRAEVLQKDLRSQADIEINKERESGRRELELERNRLLGDLRKQVAALSISAAQKLIGESLIQDQNSQHKLLEEFFSGVKGGKVVVLEGKALSGGHAEITSALPLTPEERETVKSEILQKSGDATTVTFKVDPSILGGLIVRVGDQIVDGSVSGQLQDLRQSLL